MGLYEEICETLRSRNFEERFHPHDLGQYLLENVPKLGTIEREDCYEWIGREAEFMSTTERASKWNFIYCMEQLMSCVGSMPRSRSLRRAIKMYMGEKSYNDGDYWTMDFSQRVISKWIYLSTPDECATMVAGFPDPIFNIMKDGIEGKITGSASACYLAGKQWDRYKFFSLKETIVRSLDSSGTERASYHWPTERYALVKEL